MTLVFCLHYVLLSKYSVKILESFISSGIFTEKFKVETLPRISFSLHKESLAGDTGHVAQHLKS